MIVKFKTPVEIEVVERFDDDDNAISATEIFTAGEEVEFDVIDHPQKFDGKELVDDKSLLNVQFPDGSMAFALSASWFDVIDG